MELETESVDEETIAPGDINRKQLGKDLKNGDGCDLLDNLTDWSESKLSSLHWKKSSWHPAMSLFTDKITVTTNPDCLAIS